MKEDRSALDRGRSRPPPWGRPASSCRTPAGPAAGGPSPAATSRPSRRRGPGPGPSSARRSRPGRAAPCRWRTITATSRSSAGTGRSVDILALAAAGEGGAALRRGVCPTSRSGRPRRASWSGPAPSSGPGAPPGVDFRIRVPESVVLTGIRISQGNLTVADVFGRLEASVDQGDLKVENFSGAVDATVGTGAADVEVLDLREEDAIAVTCRRGDIVLRLQPGVGAIVEADAPRGRVRSEFPLGVALPAPAVKGWIGQGGPDILLRAPNGRIDIVKIKAIPAGTSPRLAGTEEGTWKSSRLEDDRDDRPEEEKKGIGGLVAAILGILAALAALYYFVFMKKPARPAPEPAPAAETVRAARRGEAPRRRPAGEAMAFPAVALGESDRGRPGVRRGPLGRPGVRSAGCSPRTSSGSSSSPSTTSPTG
ncbi:MAG: hypothetical protein MZV70_52920 [Desulfobacterales bacterium]|nr:hypothetical protein [Desulfobacterales bacterium]